MDDLFSSPASATAAAAAGSLQTSNAGDLGAVGGADNSSTHRGRVVRIESILCLERYQLPRCEYGTRM